MEFLTTDLLWTWIPILVLVALPLLGGVIYMVSREKSQKEIKVSFGPVNTIRVILGGLAAIITAPFMAVMYFCWTPAIFITLLTAFTLFEFGVSANNNLIITCIVAVVSTAIFYFWKDSNIEQKPSD